MIEIVFALVAWLTPAEDAAALQRTARELEADAAIENLAAARVAGALYSIDPDLLLAIAYKESRYRTDVIGPPVRGKRACGVMQPIMREACPEQSLLAGYLEGAAHLRRWIQATPNLLTALQGYAGGYSMIEKCKLGPVERERAGLVIDLCTARELRRARWIRQERYRISTPRLAI